MSSSTVRAFIWICLCFTTVLADDETKNSTRHNPSARTFSEISGNRLPSYLEKYYGSVDPPHRYDKENSLPYEVPSGFDQFVPDKSDGAKYNYGSIYLPYPLDAPPDRVTGDGGDKMSALSPQSYNQKPSPIKDLIAKVFNFFTGGSDVNSSEVEVRPSFLSTLGNIFKDPTIALTALIVPLGLILFTVIPYLAKLFVSPIMSPAVSSAIAGAVARGLENPEVEQILSAVSEFGARAVDDPRCFQRLLCQTAKAHIESRSGGFWSAQRVVQKLAKSVDDKVWDALGLKILFSSLKSGHCENLQCRSGASNSTKSFFDILQLLLQKLFHTTQVVQ